MRLALSNPAQRAKDALDELIEKVGFNTEFAIKFERGPLHRSETRATEGEGGEAASSESPGTGRSRE